MSVFHRLSMRYCDICRFFLAVLRYLSNFLRYCGVRHPPMSTSTAIHLLRAQLVMSIIPACYSDNLLDYVEDWTDITISIVCPRHSLRNIDTLRILQIDSLSVCNNCSLNDLKGDVHSIDSMMEDGFVCVHLNLFTNASFLLYGIISKVTNAVLSTFPTLVVGRTYSL